MRKFFQMAAIFFILLSTPVQACADHVFLSEYKQTLFNLGSGLGADEANDVLQTADGYVWVASYSGLLRYDCTDFLRFAGGRSGFAAKSATALYEDRGSRLWASLSARRAASSAISPTSRGDILTPSAPSPRGVTERYISAPQAALGA